jgi:hypothetical protein
MDQVNPMALKNLNENVISIKIVIKKMEGIGWG